MEHDGSDYPFTFSAILFPHPLTVSPLTSHSVFYFTFDIITTIRINSYLDNQYEDQGHNKGYQVRL